MLRSANLKLREAAESDTDFILKLINQPAWKKYISNHSIRTPDQAREYIETKLIAMYRHFGFGLWVVESAQENLPVGLCGLVKRESLEHIDLGFGFLPRYWGQGFAYEASVLCLQYAFESLKTEKVLAITVPANDRSVKLLESLGFDYKEDYSHPGDDEVLALYEIGTQAIAVKNT
ncbi:MAG: GNAT family N-acetyltransferase [Pseudomonadota bacterium]